MAAATQRFITAAAFDDLPNTQGYELIDGHLRRKSMGAESSWIQVTLGALLVTHVRAGGYGFVFDSECSYDCFPRRPNRVRKPDVSFVRLGRLPDNRIPTGSIRIAPDFVIEVVSPRDKVTVLADKIADYESAAVPLIWVVYPSNRIVQVRTQGAIREFGGQDELTGDPVLPGFRVRVADLFPPPAEGPAP